MIITSNGMPSLRNGWSNLTLMSKPKKSKVIQPLKLDLGCGQNKQPGFTGVDLYAPGADVKLDLLDWGIKDNNQPELKKWPWKDNTVDEIFCSHFVEHVPASLRWPFFVECWRILKLEGVMRVFVPSWKSERAYGDMTHQWPPVTTFFFLYLNKGWREANKLTYGPYDIRCNFETQSGPTQIVGPFAERNPEAQSFACNHYLEAYPDMWATLTKKAI